MPDLLSWGPADAALRQLRCECQWAIGRGRGTSRVLSIVLHIWQLSRTWWMPPRRPPVGPLPPRSTAWAPPPDIAVVPLMTQTALVSGCANDGGAF